MSNARRTALVTGSSKNIGRAVAYALADQGRDLVLSARSDREGLEETAAEARRRGARVALRMADFQDPVSVERLAHEAEEAFGAVDILVNVHVMRVDGPLPDLTLEGWEASLRVNLTAPFLLGRALVPRMAERGWGRVVNFGGITSWLGVAERAPISTVKHGIIGLTHTLAREYGPQGVTANAISPGIVETEFVRGFITHHTLFQHLQAVPRLGKPQEIAAAVAFLCSEDAAYVNGQTISVNGGMFMT